MIQTAIIHSKAERTFLEHAGITIYCISGFKERYGREPLPTDKIRIVYNQYFFINQGHYPNGVANYGITSALNFDVA